MSRFPGSAAKAPKNRGHRDDLERSVRTRSTVVEQLLLGTSKSLCYVTLRALSLYEAAAGPSIEELECPCELC
jgi:hypothetical protein